MAFFFLEPKETNQKLIESIDNGNNLMLRGHRGSGKTTRCIYAIENQLPNFTCFWISFQSGFTRDMSIEVFWQKFGECLKEALPKNIQSTVIVKDGSTFISFLCGTTKRKEIVLSSF